MAGAVGEALTPQGPHGPPKILQSALGGHLGSRPQGWELPPGRALGSLSCSWQRGQERSGAPQGFESWWGWGGEYVSEMPRSAWKGAILTQAQLGHQLA